MLKQKTERDLYGVERNTATGSVDSYVIPLADVGRHRVLSSPDAAEYWARKLDITVVLDWGGRRAVAPSDARRIVDAQRERDTQRAKDEAAYQAYCDTKREAAREKAQQERVAAREKAQQRQSKVNAGLFEEAARRNAELAAQAAAERALADQPVSFDQWKAGKG
ncbi:MAG: hypothetical protein ACRDZ3_19975 [Acidimicrobiia bacterium]